MDLPYAEDIGHYWETSKSSPEVWMDRARRLIGELGGVVNAEAFGSVEDRAAYMITFTMGEDKYKVVWPVLPSRRIPSGNPLYRRIVI